MAHMRSSLIWRRKAAAGGCNRAFIDSVRRAAWGRDVIFHGTRYPNQVLASDRMLFSRSGYRAVCFTRLAEVAVYWAEVKRDDDEGCGAVLILHRPSLRRRYPLVPCHDTIWDTVDRMHFEAEEQVRERDILHISRYILAVFQPETE